MKIKIINSISNNIQTIYKVYKNEIVEVITTKIIEEEPYTISESTFYNFQSVENDKNYDIDENWLEIKRVDGELYLTFISSGLNHDDDNDEYISIVDNDLEELDLNDDINFIDIQPFYLDDSSNQYYQTEQLKEEVKSLKNQLMNEKKKNETQILELLELLMMS